MIARPIHRYISFIIDLTVTGILGFAAAYPAIIALFEALASRTRPNILNLLYISLISGAVITILTITYFLVLPLLWKKQTIGRFLTRIAIVKEDGSSIDFQTLFVREVVGRMLPSLMSFGLSLISEAYLISRQGRTSFSDALARTKVVDI
jgi:uncharacterized RDD family membrane protein YckC